MGVHVAVIGAGAFGGWTALALLRAGARVTLIDRWGPGNARASSGGETRLIRGIYGPDPIYIQWTAQAFALWRELEAQSNQQLYVKTGALWMFGQDDLYARSSLPHMKKAGLNVMQLPQENARKHFPQVRWDDIQSIFLEDEAGFLFARRACEVVWQRFCAEGGTVLRAHAKPGKIKAGKLSELVLSDQSRFVADVYVFACGPWLPLLFPQLLGELIRATRQEVFYFGLGPSASTFEQLPVWMDFGERIFYGVPDGDYRGFKAADDTRGVAFDPSSEDRLIRADSLQAMRDQLSWRFPGIGSLPLLESRVCQYENSLDGQFIIDRHPDATNLRILGGGSGHGFKLGPALGRYMADRILDDEDTDPFFALSRFCEPYSKTVQLHR